MDPLSVSASIVALLQSSIVIHYLSDVKGGPKELQRIRLEISSVLSLLITLLRLGRLSNSGRCVLIHIVLAPCPKWALSTIPFGLGAIGMEIGPCRALKEGG